MQTIGTESHKTWACVRAPIFNGPGFTSGGSGPATSENWFVGYPDNPNSGSAGYAKPLTDLLKGYPYRQAEGATGGPAVCYSTAMGCNEEAYYNSDSGRHYVYRLTIGEGILDLSTTPTPPFPAVKNPTNNVFAGYSTPPEDGIGYDFNTIENHLKDAVVNITVYDTNGSVYTLDVDIYTTYSFQPSPPFSASPLVGGQAFFTTAEIPYYSSPDPRPTPWWVINSLTLAP